MASSSFMLSDSTVQKMLECPVCLEVGKTPKILNCGHNICAHCETVMSRQRNHIACPVCRVETNVPIGGLATNYSLSDLIAHLTQAEAEQRHACGSCPERGTANKMFRCLRCNGVIVCSYCAVKHHGGHKLDELKELIGQRWHEIREWRKGVNDKYLEVSANATKLDVKKQQLTAATRNFSRFLIDDVVPRVDMMSEESKKTYEGFKSDLEAFVSGENKEANVIGSATEDCARREQSISTTNDQLKQVLEKQNKAVSVMQKAEKEIRAILGVVDRPPRPPSVAVHHPAPINATNTSRLSMNDRFMRLIGARSSGVSSNVHVRTRPTAVIRSAVSSSSSPSPSRLLSSPVLPNNSRQRTTIRLSVNPIRVVATPHTSDFSSRSPSPIGRSYRLTTPSPIAIDDDSDVVDASRSPTVDDDDDTNEINNIFVVGSQSANVPRSPVHVTFDDVSSDSDDTVDLGRTRQQQVADETSSSGQRREQLRKRRRRLNVVSQPSSPALFSDMPSTSHRHRAQPSSSRRTTSRPRRMSSPKAYYRRERIISSESD